ncbi:MAG TPA: 4-hydroxy-tetrahydrodipicolinate reductase, partial [Burkholderiales bacterium]|nr:4-hydroxy-tetrahydrodipicolinate reductase [Burkholderiales bacterium]
MKVAITGAGGKMGRALIEAVQADGSLTLGAALDAAGSAALGTKVGNVTVGSDIQA